MLGVHGLPPLFTHRSQYNFDHQNGGHNTDISNSEQVRNKVYTQKDCKVKN